MKLLCLIFGHCWSLFDGNWCGIDMWRCRRCFLMIERPTEDREQVRKELRVKTPPCWF